MHPAERRQVSALDQAAANLSFRLRAMGAARAQHEAAVLLDQAYSGLAEITCEAARVRRDAELAYGEAQTAWLKAAENHDTALLADMGITPCL